MTRPLGRVAGRPGYAPFIAGLAGSGSPFPWWFPGSSLDLDFVNGSGFQGSPSTLANLLTVVNSTGGYVDNLSGIWTSVGANTLRQSNKGLLVETAATNLALWCRDFTNAVWVKLNVTAALTATGIDGGANSASTLTATANAGTILQTISLSSAARTLSFWVKRRTGVGTISISQDGLAWTDVTASINASTYSKVTLTATQLNPVIGFQFGTSADAVDVDFCGLEAGTFATSPILTTTVSVARSSDLISLSSVAGISLVAGSMYIEHMDLGPVAANGSLFSILVDTNNYNTIRRSSTNVMQALTVVGGASQATIASAGSVVAGTVYRTAYSFAANDYRVRYTASLGADPADDTSGSVTSSSVVTVYIGASQGAGTQPNGYIRRVAYGQQTKPSAELAAWAQAV